MTQTSLLPADPADPAQNAHEQMMASFRHYGNVMTDHGLTQYEMLVMLGMVGQCLEPVSGTTLVHRSGVPRGHLLDVMAQLMSDEFFIRQPASRYYQMTPQGRRRMADLVPRVDLASWCLHRDALLQRQGIKPQEAPEAPEAYDASPCEHEGGEA